MRPRAPAWRRLLAALPLALSALTVDAATMTDDDPWLWLEEVQGERALAWVRERNAETLQELQARPDFAPTRERLLRILNARDRIPSVQRIGDHLYNLWQDDTHPRGVWRRTTLAQYARAEPVWETVLDLDALGRAEGENWVWAGARCLGPVYRRCLVSLSRGGADAHVQREFDLSEKRFVEGGFVLPEAKSEADWIDADHLYVGTDFGPGSLTRSGYPRVIKRWARGTPLAEAVTVFEGQEEDVAVDVSVDTTPGFGRTVFRRALDFYRQQRFVLQPDGGLLPLAVPEDASIAFMHSAGTRGDTLLVELRSDWSTGGSTYPSGSLLASDAPAFFAGQPRWQLLFEPGPTRSLEGFSFTRRHVLLDVLDNVTGRLEEWRRGGDGRFVRRVVATPSPGSFTIAPLNDPLRRDDPLAEQYLLGYTDFLTPDTLWLARTGSDRRSTLKTLPAAFDTAGMRAEQHFATSRDGTRVPYFVVTPRGESPGPRPTLLYGYGGFRISLNPRYMRPVGAAWLERGGVFVLANIRGGGEFGPRWHQAALRENRQRAYDDFIAVAEDLINRGVTTPKQLGIEGGSNGGLLVGAVMVQRPELFNAVVCQVPLLDMRRYHRLLAGASWMAEYGNPDEPADWDFISRYSPYQNLKPGVRYPRALIDTSTRDDRVHPGHARKFAARLRELGQPVMYYENIEGGHGGAADNAQRATLQAIEYGYLWQQLGGHE